MEWNGAKAMEIVTLTRVEGANLNSNGTEGVISVLKKAKDPVDMKEYVRISGQSYKRQLRELIAEIAGTDKISSREKPVVKDEKGRAQKTVIVSEGNCFAKEEKKRKISQKTVIVSEGNPVRYIDDDLFGYMLADSRKRVAPVRTNGMISLFPYQEDRDFGVAYNPDPAIREHNIFETEISTNVMRGNVFVELDRIGVFSESELNGLAGDDAKSTTLLKGEIENRLRILLTAVLDYHGGAHLSRFFTKTYPEAVAVVFLKRKIPVIGEAFRVLPGYSDGKKMSIDLRAIRERYDTFESYIDSMLIGLFESSFANVDDLRSTFENTRCYVLTMKEFRNRILG